MCIVEHQQTEFMGYKCWIYFILFNVLIFFPFYVHTTKLSHSFNKGHQSGWPSCQSAVSQCVYRWFPSGRGQEKTNYSETWGLKEKNAFNLANYLTFPWLFAVSSKSIKRDSPRILSLLTITKPSDTMVSVMFSAEAMSEEGK